MQRIPLFILLSASLAMGGESPLADALEKGDVAATRELLRAKADPDAAQPDGTRPLHWAAWQNDLEAARLLLEAGAKPDPLNEYGVTPLSLACQNGNPAMIRLLLEKRADPNVVLKGGETPLMTVSRTGRVAGVKALLERGAKVDARDRRGQTALMWAAAEGHADVVDILLEAGADYRHTLDTGFTPLLFAVREGRIDVVRRLIRAGADVNESMAKARGGRNEPVKNTSPLILAIENGHFELGAVLLEAGADPDDARTGYSPLQTLSWARKPEKGDNETGTPPPIGSGRLTSLDFARALVKAGADVNGRKEAPGGGRNKISIVGTTPFLCAAATADVDYMKTLLELGADPKLTNQTGQTALMMAAGIGEGPEGDGPGTKEEHLAAVLFLLDEVGADVNAVDKNGETAMHGAAYKSVPQIVELFDRRGADIRIWAKPSKQGRTPLSIAQGYRPGNFKPDFETVAAIEKVMLARGVTPPPPPKKHDREYP